MLLDKTFLCFLMISPAFVHQLNIRPILKWPVFVRQFNKFGLCSPLSNIRDKLIKLEIIRLLLIGITLSNSPNNGDNVRIFIWEPPPSYYRLTKFIEITWLILSQITWKQALTMLNMNYLRILRDHILNFGH